MKKKFKLEEISVELFCQDCNMPQYASLEEFIDSGEYERNCEHCDLGIVALEDAQTNFMIDVK